mmetsp:Transcript_31235/g.61662  ORF Transcript_31235/g.61662 Transcript_31235/m.61662 type:complete len:86 (-) Transcript_31235:251-508(-)
MYKKEKERKKDERKRTKYNRQRNEAQAAVEGSSGGGRKKAGSSDRLRVDQTFIHSIINQWSLKRKWRKESNSCTLGEGQRESPLP